MAYLSIKDRQLLKYPPTEATWLCKKCEIPLAGYMTDCWACGESKPKRPKLLWPEYLLACKKAKHEPGVRWPVKANARGEGISSPQQPVRRKRAGS